MSTPNDLAKDAMARAAEKYDAVAANAEVEADLWRQCAEHLRRGQLMRADLKRHEALRARDARQRAKTVAEADKLVALVEVADREYWDRQTAEAAIDDIRDLPIELCRELLRAHRSVCRDRSCAVEVALRARMGDV